MPWFDKKHMIFGRAIAGSEVMQAIESVKKTDKPFEDTEVIAKVQ